MDNFDLKAFRKGNKLTQNDMADYFGCTQAFISLIEKGKNQLPDEYISKLQTDPAFKSAFDLYYNKPNNQTDTPIKSGVPYYDIDVTASLVESFSDIQEEPEFYVDFKPFNDCSAYLPVYGDSMYPMIASGEIVALKKIEHTEYIQYGEPHLIITNSESNNMRTIKIIRKAHDKNMIILKPSNPNFDEMEIPRNTIIGLYIVKGKITRKQL